MTSSPEATYAVTNLPCGDNNSLISLNAGTQIYPKLSSSNYPIWRVQFNALLVSYGLMAYVDGRLCRPAQFLDEANTKINPAYTHWMCQDQLIVLAILSSVTDTVITMLGGVETSKNAWDILKTMYANRSRSRILSLKEKLSRLSKAEFREVTAAICARDTPIQFQELHEKLADFELYLQCQESLPQPLVPTTHAAQRFKYPATKSKMNYGHYQNKSRSNYSSFGRKIICQYCEKPGYTAKVYYTLHGYPQRG
ncbi:PREDICTED: uncharacterized protein LOC109359707 [Lupinus angustifolius]|uniref:uncharacterized protein LOC109359707 n=1 Tax=Lupinus angustifolius TaxID=3871 RepID=UPI00092F38B3|nr:PREDICTED: uncharacterized protein LOC109359707 [Lupinus angustifolius]